MSNHGNDQTDVSAVKPNVLSPLCEVLIRYQEALEALGRLDTKGANDTELILSQLLNVLCTRDLVEKTLASDEHTAPAEELAQLIELDGQLCGLSDIIASDDRLQACRKSLQPPQTAWWWFLEPSLNQSAPTTPCRVSLDWMWNGLTVACLVVAGSFVTNTLHLFSKNGMDLLQTFGTIGQGAGLVLMSGGALTSQGKKVIGDILTSLRLSPIYQARATFIFAAVVLLATYGVNQSLPNLGDYYYRHGLQLYERGQLLSAEQKLQQALNFAANDFRISTALGNTYITLDDYHQAQSMYQLGVESGYPPSLNGMGRVLLRTAKGHDDLLNAEIYFRLGLAQPRIDIALQADLHAHLGFTLLKQAEIRSLTPEKRETIRKEAQSVLQKGIAIDQTITDNRDAGLGMSYCYLAALLDHESQAKAADQQWDLCVARALPTSTSEYRDILIYGGIDIAKRINTSKIVSQHQGRS